MNAYLRNRANILYKSCSAISLPTYQIIELPILIIVFTAYRLSLIFS